MGSRADNEIGMSAVVRRRDTAPLPAVEITRMRRRHLRRVLAIEGQVYPRPWSMSLFLSELSQKQTRSYLVAKHRSEVVGYCGMMFTAGEAHVTNIAVDPRWHGNKIGTRLLLHLVTESVARGSETISLEVRVTNEPAQAMYRKFGFAPAGIRKGYYIETNEDALVMVVENPLSTPYRLLLSAIRDEIRGLDAGDSDV